MENKHLSANRENEKIGGGGSQLSKKIEATLFALVGAWNSTQPTFLVPYSRIFEDFLSQGN